MSRIATPNLNVEQQVHQCGTGLINLFGEDLFNYLDVSLRQIKGDNWLVDLQKSSLDNRRANYRDPSTLLKILLDQGGTIFREPLRLVVPQKDVKAFYARLQIIRDDRNDWTHHQVKVNEESLKTLILNLYPIADRLALDLRQELDSILNELSPQTTAKADHVEETQIENLIVHALPIPLDNVEKTGERFDSELTQHSYSLLLNGSIKDRKSGVLLEELNPQSASQLGALLLMRKPNGGRLRLSKDGVLVAYFEEFWGYIGQVVEKEWFPGHLTLEND
jgi:hypothetical protein